MESIGERIHKLRKERGLTLQALGKLTYTSPTFICDIEQNRATPSIPRLIELANVLGTSTAYLVGETAHSTPITAEEEEIAAFLSKEESKAALACVKELMKLSAGEQQEAFHYIHYLTAHHAPTFEKEQQP